MPPPGEAKEDWKIFRALSEVLGKTLPFNNFAELREAMHKKHPHFAKFDEVKTAKLKKPEASKAKVKAKSFDYSIDNFYQTCPISRNSKTMAECSEDRAKAEKAAA